MVNLGSPVPMFAGPVLDSGGQFSVAWQQWLTAFYQKSGSWNVSSAPVAAVTLTTAYGTPGSSLVDVGTSFSQSVLNNNFASVVAKTSNLESRISAIYAALKAHGAMS